MNSEYSSLKVVDLKRELKNRGLKMTGTKEELIDRLITYKSKLTSSTGYSENGDIENLNENIIDADLLDEESMLGSNICDELDDAEEEEVLKKVHDDTSNLSNITDNDNAVMSSSDISKLTNIFSSSSSPQSNPATEKGKRRFVLVRNKSITLLGGYDKENEKTEKTNEQQNEEKMEVNNNGKHSETMEVVSKISNIDDLSMDERLLLRAKRFGLQSDEARKIARAARFGINNDSSSQEESMDVLKKRAERFGTVISPILSKKEFQEKLSARRARFSISQADSRKIEHEKKKLRAKRFNM